MKRSFLALLMLAIAVVTLNSCFGDDENKFNSYDDAAITSFVLSAGNVYTTVKSSTGADSTYKTVLVVKNYPFHINQLTHEIYNPDSLPYGTDAAHILVSLSTKNGGEAVVKSMYSDSIKSFSNTDSLDFTQERIFYVYSNSGAQVTNYKVKLNVHQQDGEKTSWNSLTADEGLAGLTAGMKAVVLGERMLVFGSDGKETNGYATALNDGKNWELLSSNLDAAFGAEAYQQLAGNGSLLFLLDGNTLYKTVDGETWEALGDKGLTMLLGATQARLYGLTAESAIVSSSDGGATWVEDEMENDVKLLPQRSISLCSNALKANPQSHQLLLGGVPAGDDVTAGVVWIKVEEADEYGHDTPWSAISAEDAGKYPLPALQNMQIVAYDNGYLALGGSGVGSYKATAFSTFYKSDDSGLTWHTDGSVTLPEGFSGNESAWTMAVDGNNNLWIITGQDGQVWRGRLNRLGWTVNEKAFTE